MVSDILQTSFAMLCPSMKIKQMIKHQSLMWFQIYHSCFMSLPGTSKVQIKKIYNLLNN